MLGFILDRNVVYSSLPSDASAKGGLGGVAKGEELRLATTQLPLEDAYAKQCFQELLSSCAAAEIVSLFL